MCILLFLYLLGVVIWVGGYLVLVFGIFFGVLCCCDFQVICVFEQVYEWIGIFVLLLQVVSGLWLVSLWLLFDYWFGVMLVVCVLQFKLLFLVVIVVLGVYVCLCLILNLDVESLLKFGWYIVVIILVGLGFVVVGQSFCFGGVF